GTGWVGNKYTFLDNNKVRLLLSRDDNKSFTNVELNTVDTEILEIKENDISKTLAKKDVKEGLFFESTGYYWSDFTFIEGRLWAFRPSDYSGIAEGVGAIYIFDENMNLIKRLLHNFGHVNSIEYNSDNDTLIFGNGSGFYDT